MILLIGRQDQDKKNKKGYTFIELILTSTILLVIIGLSVPVFRMTYSQLLVKLQARDMSSLMNLARERAIMTRAAHLIEIDPEKNSYRMFLLDIKKDKAIPIQERWGRRFSISSNIKVSTTNDMIKFFSDGSSNGTQIVLEDKSGSKSRIDIDTKTGEISVKQ